MTRALIAGCAAASHVGGADAADRSGLRGLADRVEALGGRLRIVGRAGARRLSPDCRSAIRDSR